MRILGQNWLEMPMDIAYMPSAAFLNDGVKVAFSKMRSRHAYPIHFRTAGYSL
jgi:hypothetical protein